MHEIPQYVASAAKVFRHWDWLKKFQHGPVFPINAEIGVTSACNMECDDCILQNLGDGTEMSFSLFSELIKTLRKGGTKAIEITSAEPTLWPYLPDAFRLLHHLDFRVGLKTNGIRLDSLDEQVLRNVSWIRISLQGFDHAIVPNIPRLPKSSRISASYVWHKNSTPEIVKDVAYWCNKLGIQCRLVLSVYLDDSKKREEGLALAARFSPVIYHSQRHSRPAYFCYQPYLHLYIGWDGYLYACCVFYTPERVSQFDHRWRICHVKEIADFYGKEPMDLGFRCKSCIYTDENNILADIRHHVEDEDFV